MDIGAGFLAFEEHENDCVGKAFLNVAATTKTIHYNLDTTTTESVNGESQNFRMKPTLPSCTIFILSASNSPIAAQHWMCYGVQGVCCVGRKVIASSSTNTFTDFFPRSSRPRFVFCFTQAISFSAPPHGHLRFP